jgi:hypothetical protein
MTDQNSSVEGYLFAYFTDDETSDAEGVRFALSDGLDPLHWTVLGGGTPTLVSDVGTRGARDPFLVRGLDTFYCLATDLRTNPGGDWEHAQRFGSRGIVVWQSIDLLSWSAPRLLRVAPPGVGDAWAPKAYWDGSRHQFRIFFASTLFPADDVERRQRGYHRILSSWTDDFQTASEPEVYFDRGDGAYVGADVIDLALAFTSSGVHRFFVDGTFVTQEHAATVDAAFTTVVRNIGQSDLARCEGPAVFASADGEKWYLFLDEYGGRGYQPFSCDSLSTGRWRALHAAGLPLRARHGSVLPLSGSEYASVRDAAGVVARG